MAGPPRRRPFPADVSLNSVGLMLGRPDPAKGAPLVGHKVQPFDAQAPTNYKYDSLPPFAERPTVYDDLTLGLGLKVQDGANDRKYRYALNADLSIGGLWLKGPSVSTFTPGTVDSTNGIQAFRELVISGTTTLFAVNGRYVQKYVNDASWTATDLGVGTAALGWAAEVFTSGGTGTSYLFIPRSGTDKALYFDGATATAFATFTCLAFCQVGSDFYRASDTNQLSKVDRNADPTVEANWTAANSFRVGDKSYAVTNLAKAAGGELLIFKQDGIYTIDESGQDTQLFPFLRFAPEAENGRYWGTFGNDLHVTYGKQHVRLKSTHTFGVPQIELEPIGPERITENDSAVKGRVTAFLGHGPLHAYAGLYNDDTGDSYLLKFGAWLTASVVEGQLEESKRIDAWHGSITPVFTGKKITALHKSSVGAPSGHYRCYVGFSDGSIAWFVLPCVPNPAACTSYTFSTTAGNVFLPLWHGTFVADAKTLRSLAVTGLNLSASNSVTLSYKTDPSAGAYTSFGTSFTSVPWSRADFPNNTAAYLADLEVVLASSSTASCPQVTAVSLLHAVRPKLVLEYLFQVLAADGLVKRNGTPLRIGADQIRTTVKAAVAAIGSVTTILPDESSQQLSYVDYAESLAWDDRGRQWRAALDVKAVQFVTNTVYGTWARLQPYTVHQAQAMSWQQVQGL